MAQQHTDLTFKLRRDTALAWAQKNPVLADGEPGFEKDTGRLKVGDGVLPWLTLEYTSPDSTVQAMINASIAAAGGVFNPTDPGDDGSSFLLMYENAKV